MHPSRRSARTSIWPLTSLILAAASSAFPATITDLGTLGGPCAGALGINNAGQVVGYSCNTTDAVNNHAFLYSGGSMTDLGVLTGNTSTAFGINDAGQVVGVWRTADNQQGVFLYSAGTMRDLGIPYSDARAINASGQIAGSMPSGNTDVAFLWYQGTVSSLGTLGGASSLAEGINDFGDVVGFSTTAGGLQHAFLYSGGSMIDLGTLGGSVSLANSVNNAGQVVGWSSIKGGTNHHAFLYSGGKMADLGTLGGFYSTATGINTSGQIVGFSGVKGSSNVDAFLYSAGVMVDLNSFLPPNSQWHLAEAYGINDSGLVVGIGDVNGTARAFLLDTTPEPSSISLFGLGTAALLYLRHRRQRR